MSEHDPYDFEGQQQRETERSERKAEALDEAEGDLVWLMSGPRGRRIVRRILVEAQLDFSSYSPNAMEMSRLEGRKELARGFSRLIDRLCPELRLKMHQEHDDSSRAVGNRSHQTV